nr:MAG TPA: hypothetical protein [Caudoviricetes sp.]
MRQSDGLPNNNLPPIFIQQRCSFPPVCEIPPPISGEPVSLLTAKTDK